MFAAREKHCCSYNSFQCVKRFSKHQTFYATKHSKTMNRKFMFCFSTRKVLREKNVNNRINSSAVKNMSDFVWILIEWGTSGFDTFIMFKLSCD